jgi:hypothetical protein
MTTESALVSRKLVDQRAADDRGDAVAPARPVRRRWSRGQGLTHVLVDRGEHASEGSKCCVSLLEAHPPDIRELLGVSKACHLMQRLLRSDIAGGR